MNDLWNNLNGSPNIQDGGEIGVVTQGSLTEGVEMKLNSDRSVEDVKAGKFVVIEGYKNQFFSMITDLSLDATNPEIFALSTARGRPVVAQRSQWVQHLCHRCTAAYAHAGTGRRNRR